MFKDVMRMAQSGVTKVWIVSTMTKKISQNDGILITSIANSVSELL
jgi:hypothetical protein